MKHFGALILFGLAMLLAGNARAQTVVYHDNITNTTDLETNWCWQAAPDCLLARNASQAACPSASPKGTTTCAKISVQSGDDGDNLLGPCFVSNVTGCTNNGFNLQSYSDFYTYWSLYLPSNLNVGTPPNNSKFGYFKNSGGTIAVCYWDLGIVSAGPPTTIQGRSICDLPSDQAGTYVTINTSAGWHTLEAHWASGKTFTLWWDGTSLGAFPPNYPSESIPSETFTDVQPGLYSNSAVTSTYSLYLTDFAICTGARCPGGSPPPSNPPVKFISGGVF